MRMSAYYYEFSETGVDEIDLILSAVACAGRLHHHTENWNEGGGPLDGHAGNTPIDWIQNAANKAAKKFKEK